VQRDEERQRHKEVMDEMHTAYGSLRGRVRDYHSSLRAAMV
jgi:hypothetical protein